MADRRVRIVSDGTPATTRILVDGEPLDNVTAVTWSLNVDDGLASATLRLVDAAVDVEGDLVEGDAP